MRTLLDPASYTHSAFALPIGLVAVLALGVGVWVVWHERARPVSLSFMAVTLALGTYLGGFSLMVQSATPEVAMLWGRVAYLGIPFIVPAVYHFSMDLLGLRKQRQRMIRVAWLLGVVYAELAVGTSVLVERVIRIEWGYITRITLWNIPIFLWSTAILGLAIRDYVTEYRGASPIQQARIRWFAIPLGVASLAFIDYAPSLGIDVQPWGFVVFALFLTTAALAVSRYHLPDLTPSFAADQIVDTMAEPLLVCDEHGAVAFANPAAERLLRWSGDELIGRSLHALFGAEAAETVLVCEEGHGGVELTIEDRAGDPIALSVSSNPVVGTGGRRIGTVVVARDIRDRLRAAEEIERREQRFRALIENSRETITILDATGRITFESGSVEEILGYPFGQAEGAWLLDRVHPRDLHEVALLFEELGRRPGHRVQSECRIRSRDGDYRDFAFHATNLLKNPAVGGIVVNGRDVTEERALTAQLQQAQKMEAIGRLAGGVAHDFNNILTAVQGNVAILLEETEGSPFTRELEEIRRGAERASRLTDQLLAFSRRQVLQPIVLDLNEVVADLRSMLDRLIGEGVRLETYPARELGALRADRGQLEQILMNLIVNGRDAVEGCGRLEIRTANVEVDKETARAADFQLLPGRYVLLTVSDDGHGMDEETRSRLFEPFFTTKEAGRGTGLGLSTVYGSVRQASGHIGVESRPGRGTTFSIYFPRVDAPVDDAAPVRPPRRTPAGRGEVVLVVEDEAPVRSLIARVLERRGYQVIQAEDGESAIRQAARLDGTLDLVVADLVMPGISGREVADKLSVDHPDLAIILISGYTADEVVRRGIDAGEREFLAKPFTPDDLTRKVASVLRRARYPNGAGSIAESARAEGRPAPGPNGPPTRPG